MNNNKTSTFMKGMGIGVIAGMAVAVAGKMALQNNRNISKGSGKVVKAVGEFVDGIQTMIK